MSLTNNPNGKFTFAGLVLAAVTIPMTAGCEEDKTQVQRVNVELTSTSEPINLGLVGGDRFYLQEVDGTFLLVSSASRVSTVIEHRPDPESWQRGSMHTFEVKELTGRIGGERIFILKLDGKRYAYSSSDVASITELHGPDYISNER